MPAAAKDLAAILAEPLAATRMALAEGLLTKKYDLAARDAAVAAIKAALPARDLAAATAEEAKILLALKNKSIAGAPDIATPEMQLLWAAYLTHAFAGGAPVQDWPLWAQLTTCDHARHEMRQHAMFVARDAFNPGTKLRWGLPGSMFYFEHVGNSINIDFLMSLIGGFKDTRSIFFHEIGHSKLTRSFTPLMVATRDEMAVLSQKGTDGTISAAEYGQLAMLRLKWDLLFRIFDEAENSPVNRYSINAGPKLQQDMGASLNNVEVIVARAATTPLPHDPTVDALFANAKRAIRMSLYKNNGLFTDDDAGWQRIGVRRDWIAALPSVTGQPAPNPAQAFAELMELCGGVAGLEQLQPRTVDRMKGAAWLEQVTNDYADKRNLIIDDIWTRYIAPIVQPLLDEALKKTQENIQNPPPSPFPQPPMPGMPGAGGGAASGGDGDGQGTPADGEAGNGTAQPGDGPPRDGRTDEAKPGDDKKEEDAKDKAGAGGDAPPAQEDDGNLNVENAGRQPPIPIPPRTPQEAAEQNNPPAAPGDGDGQAGDGESLEALLQQLDVAAQARQSAPGTPMPGQKGHKSNSPQAGATYGDTPPRMGDWSDYEACVTEFMPQIRQAAKLLVQIQERQSTRTTRVMPRYELEPDGGDMDLFDMARHEAVAVKLASNEKITEEDVKRFRIEEERKTPASIDIMICIDGSGSMFWGPGGGATPIQAGMQSACIINEAAKKPRDRRPKGAVKPEGDINVWTVLWGNHPPIYVTKPGDDPAHIGRAVAGILESNGWGTSLYPAVVANTQMLADYKIKENARVGAVHQIVVSDGDIGDPAQAIQAIDMLLTNSHTTTFDVLIVNERHGTQMEQALRVIHKKHGEGRCKIVVCKRPEDVHSAMLVLLRERMLATTEADAEPFRDRRRAFQKAYSQMTL